MRRSEPSTPPGIQVSIAQAHEKFDSKMAVGVFRDIAFHPVEIAAPAVPSIIVLSDESPAVLPEVRADALEREGWQVRRIDGVHHDMHLEDPDRTFAAIADVL